MYGKVGLKIEVDKWLQKEAEDKTLKNTNFKANNNLLVVLTF
jgi:hypothetical protein